jgi:hypothetical protein
MSFSDVLSEELTGMPPERDIEFVIELMYGIAPMNKRPYRMDVKQLTKLKDQIKELLEKGYQLVSFYDYPPPQRIWIK